MPDINLHIFDAREKAREWMLQHPCGVPGCQWVITRHSVSDWVVCAISVEEITKQIIYGPQCPDLGAGVMVPFGPKSPPPEPEAEVYVPKTRSERDIE